MQDSSNFTIYNASAGSGKTFKLAERYLTLLLSSPKTNSFQNILAITFTNKAVGEMKSRILDYLTYFAKEKKSLENDTMFQLIKENTKLTSDQIQKKSFFILKEILNNYAAFEISTIDAFTHRIIRTFAKDLGLSMNFDIEMDTKQILQMAVERLVNKAGKDQQLTEVLIDFALEKVNDDKSGDISRDIFEASTLLLNERDEFYINSLRDYDLEDFKTLKLKLKKEIESISNQLKLTGIEFLHKMEDKGLTSKDFSRGSIPKYFEKLSEDNRLLKFESKWQLQIEDEDSYVTKKLSENTKQVIFSMKDFIVEKFLSSKTLFSDRKFYEKILKNITQLSLLSAVKEEMESIKKEQNVMLISDFNKKISDEIKKQPAPFIFERLGEKFQHYFVDEFQDTSKMQWNNLIPLTGNALATLFEGDFPGTLTLVGDAKQSIYAWRGGDAHQFMELSSGYSPFSAQPKLETLGTNFRSCKNIVTFNNEFFEYIGTQLNDEKLKHLFSGNRLTQSPYSTESGYVSLKFLEAENNEERDKVYPEEVLNIIEAKERQGYQRSDICVLVRKKREGVAIAEYLNAHQVPIISSETLLIKSDEQVQFLLSLFKVVDNEFDEISKAKMMEKLSSGASHSEEEKFELLNKTIGTANEKFWETVSSFGFDFDSKTFLSLPFYDAVEYAIDKFNMNKTGNAYLQFFLDEVFEFTLKNQGELSAFLNYWSMQEDSKSIISSGRKDAVQIMTVHKSKGLQFPIVIFPYAKQQIDYTFNSHLWVNLDEKFKIPYALITKPSQLDHPLYTQKYLELISGLEMENINIFYVSLTRASQELYIISEDDRDKSEKVKNNTFSGLLMGFVKSSKQLSIETGIDYSWGESKFTNQESNSDTKTKVKELNFHSPSEELNLNLVTTAGKLWNEQLEQAKEEGNLIHSLLSKIKYHNDLEHSLEWHIYNGFIEHQESQKYKDLLNTVIFHPELEKYYTHTFSVWNEKDIYYQSKLLRPDRVVFDKDAAYIIDYKTGLPSNTHENQVNEYAKALSSLKFNVKKVLLVYITDSIEVKIV
jgi:ATP-dependent exoDNAse (exonuclease V) beta subunit